MLKTKEKDDYVNLIRETHRSLRRKLNDGIVEHTTVLLAACLFVNLRLTFLRINAMNDD